MLEKLVATKYREEFGKGYYALYTLHKKERGTVYWGWEVFCQEGQVCSGSLDNLEKAVARVHWLLEPLVGPPT